MPTTVADQLVRGLVAAGVQRIYGIVGDSLNPVVDAVRRTGGSDTRKPRPSPHRPMRRPPVRWPSAPVPAGPGTCI
jgi:hypothetical protein